MPQFRTLMLLALVIMSMTLPHASRAQGERLCFPRVPGINACVEGRFREYWEQQGGLSVFGYPLRPASQEYNGDGTYLLQWFERNSFEAHPENAAPYDVLLGRLGDLRLQQLGRDWFAFPRADPNTPHYFSQTGHAISHEPFWNYWSSHGLEFDGRSGTSEAESLALFGLPLSEPSMETNLAGDTVLTQWFERARLEEHGAKGVLLGLLGSEVLDMPLSTPQPPTPALPPPSGDVCGEIPNPISGSMLSNCVHGGELLTAMATGFQKGERVGFYATNATGSAFDFPVWSGDPSPNASGEYRIQGALGRYTDPGIYNLVLQGTKSGHTAILPFRILPLDSHVSGTQDFSLIPEGINAVAEPASGIRGTVFRFQTKGFAGETVGVYLTLPDGTVLGAPFHVRTDMDGNVDQRLQLFSDDSDPVGIVISTFEGVDSHKKAYAYIRYTQ